MTTPVRTCRCCGSDHFVETGPVEWAVRHQSPDGAVEVALAGTLVICVRCGLLETFMDHPLDLTAVPEAHEVHVTADPGTDRETLPTGESPAGSGWQVVLVHAGERPIGVIAALRKELPMSFVTARASISRLPWVLTRTSNRRVADALSEKLAAVGAVVRIEPSSV
ncbi:MAG: hypothetical protein JW751_30630 [Polyangiaceae bacterium]|nr:hypothetical protein [Polyangiaceae bacterium]